MEDGIGKSLFVLATTEAEKLLPTIHSRGVLLNITTFTNDDIVQRLSYICSLESIQYEKSDLDLIAIISQGHMRDAVKYLDIYTENNKLVIPEDANPYTLAKLLLFGDDKSVQDSIRRVLNTYSVNELYDFMHNFFLKVALDIPFANSIGIDLSTALRIETYFNRVGYISQVTFAVDVANARHALLTSDTNKMCFGLRGKKSIKETALNMPEVPLDKQIKQGLIAALRELV
jgi:DNA polymerase III gamma/tau subunit